MKWIFNIIFLPMPELKSLLMLLVITIVGAGVTLYISKKHKDQIDVVVVSTTDAVAPAASSTEPKAPVTPTAPKPVATGTASATPKPPLTGPQGIAPSLTGTLTAVDTGCFSDGVCSATVAGKKVVLLIGRYQGKLGKIIGADSIGDLEAHIGEQATVFAGADADGNFTLLGNEMFYLQVASSSKPVTTAACVIGGCSAQLCGEKSDLDGMVTSCEYREEYACYKQTKCERQTTGKCGWTETPELTMCLKKAS